MSTDEVLKSTHNNLRLQMRIVLPFFSWAHCTPVTTGHHSPWRGFSIVPLECYPYASGSLTASSYNYLSAFHYVWFGPMLVINHNILQIIIAPLSILSVSPPLIALLLVMISMPIRPYLMFLLIIRRHDFVVPACAAVSVAEARNRVNRL